MENTDVDANTELEVELVEEIIGCEGEYFHLQEVNSHPRDANIHFYEVGHKYEVDGAENVKFTSVTTFCHGLFPKFDENAVISKILKSSKMRDPTHKYYGMTAEMIKQSWECNRNSVADMGTKMHKYIEEFMNGRWVTDMSILSTKYTHAILHAEFMKWWLEMDGRYVEDEVLHSVEWTYFLQYVCDNPDFVPYRTEWMIYQVDAAIAGSIDMVYENLDDGSLSIYDWKRCKEITKETRWSEYGTHVVMRTTPATNYWQYALQLNTYKFVLEGMYGKKIRNLCLVQLHPDQKNYVLVPLPILTDTVQILFTERIEGKIPADVLKRFKKNGDGVDSDDYVDEELMDTPPPQARQLLISRFFKGSKK